MNLQTLALPTCDSTVVAVCLWIPEAVGEMKDCPCFRKDHVTHMVWFHFVSFFVFLFLPVQLLIFKAILFLKLIRGSLDGLNTDSSQVMV